ncbi:unnamed protein product, partial [Caretta caretta]
VFFLTASPWMAALLVILFLSIALLAAVPYKLAHLDYHTHYNNDTTSLNEKETMKV